MPTHGGTLLQNLNIHSQIAIIVSGSTAIITLLPLFPRVSNLSILLLFPLIAFSYVLGQSAHWLSFQLVQRLGLLTHRELAQRALSDSEGHEEFRQQRKLSWPTNTEIVEEIIDQLPVEEDEISDEGGTNVYPHLVSQTKTQSNTFSEYLRAVYALVRGLLLLSILSTVLYVSLVVATAAGIWFLPSYNPLVQSPTVYVSLSLITASFSLLYYIGFEQYVEYYVQYLLVDFYSLCCTD